MEYLLFTEQSDYKFKINNDIKNYLNKYDKLHRDNINIAVDLYGDLQQKYFCFNNNVCKYLTYDKEHDDFSFIFRFNDLNENQMKALQSQISKVTYNMTLENYKMLCYYFIERNEFYKIIIQIHHYEVLKPEILQGLSKLLLNYNQDDQDLENLNKSDKDRLFMAITLFNNELVAKKIISDLEGHEILIKDSVDSHIITMKKTNTAIFYDGNPKNLIEKKNKLANETPETAIEVPEILNRDEVKCFDQLSLSKDSKLSDQEYLNSFNKEFTKLELDNPEYYTIVDDKHTFLDKNVTNINSDEIEKDQSVLVRLNFEYSNLSERDTINTEPKAKYFALKADPTISLGHSAGYEIEKLTELEDQMN